MLDREDIQHNAEELEVLRYWGVYFYRDVCQTYLMAIQWEEWAEEKAKDEEDKKFYLSTAKGYRKSAATGKKVTDYLCGHPERQFHPPGGRPTKWTDHDAGRRILSEKEWWDSVWNAPGIQLMLNKREEDSEGKEKEGGLVLPD